LLPTSQRMEEGAGMEKIKFVDVMVFYGTKKCI
jgi:hypothetical protein